MDSANSGSLPSSSGGDDDFDSRPAPGVDPLLSFFHSSTTASTTAPAPAPHAPPAPPPHLLPYDGAFATSHLIQPPARHDHQDHPPAARPNSSAPAPAAPPSRPSRKRTRASRRAPTTVLTTDTSNFRAMVQEFTGIPSPPFAPSHALPRSTARFDHPLFSSAGSPSSSSHLQPPYLLRPFAHKLHSPLQTTVATATSSPIPATSTAGLTAITNDQAHGQTTLLNMPNSLLSFQSLLQSQLQPRYDPRSMQLNFASAPAAHAPPMGTVSNDYSGAAAPHALLGSHKLHQAPWLGTGSGSVSGSGHGDGPNMPESIQLNPAVSADYAASTPHQRASTSCKFNYSTAGSSEFVNVSREQDAAVVAAATRGEGMVDSWLCSSSSDR